MASRPPALHLDFLPPLGSRLGTTLSPEWPLLSPPSFLSDGDDCITASFAGLQPQSVSPASPHTARASQHTITPSTSPTPITHARSEPELAVASTERRKSRHRSSEKRRRDDLRVVFVELMQALPSTKRRYRRRDLTHAAILDTVVRHIRNLQEQKASLQAQCLAQQQANRTLEQCVHDLEVLSVPPVVPLVDPLPPLDLQ